MWGFSDMHGYFGSGYMWLWFLFMTLVVVLVIVTALKYHGAQNNRPKESASDILEKRFARGEISQEEYQSMKQVLESN